MAKVKHACRRFLEVMKCQGWEYQENISTDETKTFTKIIDGKKCYTAFNYNYEKLRWDVKY